MSRYKKDERKHKKVPTTELLDFTAKEIDYNKDKERDKQYEYKDELEQRDPFDKIKAKLDRHSEQIEKINKVLGSLLKHRHDTNGNVVIPIDELEREVGRVIF